MNATTATRSVSGRLLLRLSAMLAVLLLALSGQSALAAGSAGAHSTPAGRWDVFVTIHAASPPLVSHNHFTFGEGDRITSREAPGEPVLPGQGIWKASGRHTFSFWITHPHPDPHGVQIGNINAVHEAKLLSNRFSTNATAYIVLFDGTWIGPITVQAIGVRIP